MNKLIERKQRLRKLENEIRSGMEEFYYVGVKLKQIRDDELYKSDGFDTWKQYCRERWDWSDERARQLMVASEYREKLPSPPKPTEDEDGPTSCWTEASVRVLTRIPDKKQAARVAKKVIQEVERSTKEAAKNPDVKPLKLSASTVRKFVDEDLGVKPKPKAKPQPKTQGIDLAQYLRDKIGTIRGVLSNLTEVPEEGWELLEESEPDLVKRLATACDELAEFLRS